MLAKWFTRLYYALMYIIVVSICAHFFGPMLAQASPITNVFINEIHYDNAGGDKKEFIELAASAGVNLSGWSLHFYNGSNGNTYLPTYTFSDWLIEDTINSFGFAAVDILGIQNGSPDGIVLADADNNIIQFLSYEGSFIANSGIAAGLTSTDIGVRETSSTPEGFSLQLAGQGSQYEDFSWFSPQLSTFGQLNTGQSFINFQGSSVPVNEPNSFMLFLSFLGILFVKRKSFFEVIKYIKPFDCSYFALRANGENQQILPTSTAHTSRPGRAVECNSSPLRRVQGG